MEFEHGHFASNPHDRLHTLGLRALDKLLRGPESSSLIRILVLHDSRRDAERLRNSGLLQHFDYFIASQLAAVYANPDGQVCS